VTVAEIELRLRETLGAVHVEIEDESRLHAGHGATGGHYRAVVVAERFAGLSRVAAQRLVYAALGDWMQGPIHAFAVRTFTPEEWQAVDRADPAHGR
jgi:BolA family transcriptional regulator, general stress-responsive regulator